MLSVKAHRGYGIVSTAGVLATFGGAGFRGDVTTKLRGSVVAIAATRDANGYWMVTSLGEVLAFGDAVSYGSVDAPSSSPIVAFAATHDGKGYWLVTSQGQVLTFGDAVSYGSAAGRGLGGRVVAITATRDGRGYWMVTSLGEVLAFGDAVFYGASVVSSIWPIAAMAATHDGKGYWLVTSHGQVLTFGDAVYFSPTSGRVASGSIVGMAVTSDGAGFLLVGSNGDVFTFGDAKNEGSDVNPAEPPNEPAGFTDVDPAVVAVVYLAAGERWNSTGPVTVTYFGDSLAWLDEIYSSVVAANYDTSLADAATPGCGIAGPGEIAMSGSGGTYPPLACANWYQRMEQALASEHPDVVVIELGYWEAQSHLWNGSWATLTGNPAYAAAVQTNLRSLIDLIESRGAVPVLVTSPYYADGTSNAQVDAWNSIVASEAASSRTALLDLNRVLDPTGSYASTVDGIDARTSDGVHLTSDGVTKIIDPWLLPAVKKLGLKTQRTDAFAF